MSDSRGPSILRRLGERLLSSMGAVALTLAFFLVLPMIQAINARESDNEIIVDFDTPNLPPPPPPTQEEEPEPEPEEEEPPPELNEEPQPLDLSQLELALNPSFGGGGWGADFTLELDNIAGNSEAMDEIFTLADLDQKPRVIYQPGPNVGDRVRRKAPGTAYVLFIVNESGRVENARIQSSTDPIFERPALDAVKQWKFEPGRRKGEAVSFRMRVPITIPGKR